MKKLLTIPLIAVTAFCNAQEVKKDTILSSDWKKLKRIHIMSTDVVVKDSANGDEKALLKIRFLDYKDKHIKNYYADLDPKKREFAGHSESYWGPTAMRSLSVMTVPFKVRARNKDGYVTAKADVDNIGLYVPFYLKNIQRYWLDDSSNHKITIGVLLAPMAEELSDKNTQNFFNDPDKSYTALMFSTSLAATYTYKKITFALIPLGFDFGTDSAGKNWVNHGKYWFGFGIGIDTELFGF